MKKLDFVGKMLAESQGETCQMAKLKLNITGLTCFIRTATTPEELHKVLVQAFTTANDGDLPTITEIEQMFLAVDTIRQSEGLERLWIQ